MNAADTLVVIQAQKDALILSQKEYEVGAKVHAEDYLHHPDHAVDHLAFRR